MLIVFLTKNTLILTHYWRLSRITNFLGLQMIQRRLRSGFTKRYEYFYKNKWLTPLQLVEFGKGLNHKNITDRLSSGKYSNLKDLLNDPKSRDRAKIVPVDWDLLDGAWPVN